MSVLTAEMWKNHPEEYFAMRADLTKSQGYQSALKGIMEAQQWCDNFDNRKELAEILSARITSIFSRHPCRTIPGQSTTWGWSCYRR